MKQVFEIRVPVDTDVSVYAVQQAIAVACDKAGVRPCERAVFELIGSKHQISEICEVSAWFNSQPIGVFIKPTIDWDYEEYRWAIRHGDVVVTSPGASS